MSITVDGLLKIKRMLKCNYKDKISLREWINNVNKVYAIHCNKCGILTSYSTNYYTEDSILCVNCGQEILANIT